jgi:hypothetical protein
MPKETTKASAFCAWCIYRDGDDCTNPESPVSGRECGPVCSGHLRCTVQHPVDALAEAQEGTGKRLISA